MRFITITLIVHAPDPATSAQVCTAQRFREVTDSARLAEELGFDGSVPASAATADTADAPAAVSPVATTG